MKVARVYSNRNEHNDYALRYIEHGTKNRHFLAIKFPKDANAHDEVAGLIADISESIADDFNAQEILHALSDELAARYERT